MRPSKPSKSGAKRLPAPSALEAAPDEHAFAEVVEMIQAARGRALAAVNTELIDLYWRVGEYISRKLETAVWGEGVIEALASYIQGHHPNLRGFTRPNLFRMRQFFEAYRGDEKVSPLVRQLPWTHHLIILGQSKRPEEREFYLRLAIRERWGKRELERQLRAAAFERAVISPAIVSPLMAQMHPEALGVFKDSYVVEFLELSGEHSENDLHRGLVNRLKDFLIELGLDFCFVGSEYPVQVGNRDFALDLLFFHRGLNCLCAIDRVRPEPLSLADAGRRVPDPTAGQATPAGQAARILRTDRDGNRMTPKKLIEVALPPEAIIKASERIGQRHRSFDTQPMRTGTLAPRTAGP
jgi:predicted nuclease of restriction endonuclease-like (RecB) superfamily